MAASSQVSATAPEQAPLRSSLELLWRRLCQQWQAEGVREFAQQLDELVGQADGRIGERAANLAAYFATFADGALSPSRSQLVHLNELAKQLFQDPDTRHDAPGEATHEPAHHPIPARNTVCLLDIREEQVPGLVDSLVERGYRLRQFGDPEGLARYLDRTRPGALLLDAAHLRILPRLADQLGEASPGSLFGPALMVLSDTRDLTHRLLAMRAGALAFFGPPQDAHRIVSRIEQALGHQEVAAYRVLIADADPSHATQCGRWLAEQGMTARLAFNAAGTMMALEEFRPDICLLDAELPDASGLELVHLIRQQTEYAGVPIVLYRNHANESQRLDAVAAGADELLVKPLKPRHVQAIVHSRMQHTQRLRGGQLPVRHRDPRTGLHHRQYLIEQLTLKTLPAGSALLLVLFDRPELIRETVGLEGLPQLETDTAQGLREAVSPSDLIAPLRDFAYLVLLQREHRDQITQVAERVKYRLQEKQAGKPGQSVAISVSVGITLLADGGNSVDARVARAEAAALAATRVGGQRILWYEPNEYALVKPDPQLAVRAVLARPWHEGNHALAFQPLVALSGKLSGQFDLRYNLVSSQEPGVQVEYAVYAKIAQEMDALAELERRRLGAALRARETSLRQGRQIRLFLPMLGASLAQEPLMQWLLHELRTRKLSGTGLTLELPSADFVDRREALAQCLSPLRQAGIRIGLSDYGRDWAAVHLLSSLPVDFLRLDPELVRHTSTDKAVNQTLLSLVHKAHALGASVVAPEVESIDRAHVLLRLGIDYGVGDGLGPTAAEPDFDFNRPLW